MTVVPFKELFRQSAFVKGFKDKTPLIIRNSGQAAFRGSHFGLKRDLPVPIEGHRLILLQNLDESIGYTRFTDVTVQPGHRLVLAHLRDKIKSSDSKDFAVKGRFLGYHGKAKRDIVIGLGGLRAILWRRNMNFSSWEDVKAKVTEKSEDTFYLKKVFGVVDQPKGDADEDSKSYHPLPHGFLAEVSMKK